MHHQQYPPPPRPPCPGPGWVWLPRVRGQGGCWVEPVDEADEETEAEEDAR